jgi:hypothetical protein
VMIAMRCVRIVGCWFFRQHAWTMDHYGRKFCRWCRQCYARYGKEPANRSATTKTLENGDRKRRSTRARNVIEIGTRATIDPVRHDAGEEFDVRRTRDLAAHRFHPPNFPNREVHDFARHKRDTLRARVEKAVGLFRRPLLKPGP